METFTSVASSFWNPVVSTIFAGMLPYMNCWLVKYKLCETKFSIGTYFHFINPVHDI